MLLGILKEEGGLFTRILRGFFTRILSKETGFFTRILRAPNGTL